MQELWFLCMTRRLNVLYKCMKFRYRISLTVINFVTDRRMQGEKQHVSRPFQGGDISH